MRLARGIEVGHLFQLGTRYSTALDALYTDEAGRRQPIVMGSYGMGVGRALACIAEEHNDVNGLALPISVAPYQVALVALAKSEATRQKADRLYQELQQAEIEVLYDDRDMSPGAKFVEADLRGLPLRLTIADRSLEKGNVELRHRRSKDIRPVPVDDAVSAVTAEIAKLNEEVPRRIASAPTWVESKQD
jgi:prolyl-tRNA synthetase